MESIISIHALLAESDSPHSINYMIHTQFLSTLSLRRATGQKHINSGPYHVISIHALLAESDDNLTQGVFNLFTFLSTLSLRRATPPYNLIIQRTKNFYPRSPCGERQVVLFVHFCDITISIHALLAESDTTRGWPLTARRHFYPRSPCGERRSPGFGLCRP